MRTKERPLTDFASQLIPERDQNPDAIRKRLVESLIPGITVNLSDEKTITFQLQVENVENPYAEAGTESKNIGILLLDREKQVASVKTAVYFDCPIESQELSKYYSQTSPNDIKGRGLITTATALLFQVLIERGVETVWGKIDGRVENVASIRSRLKTPNIIGGGFFATEHKVIPRSDHSSELYLISHLRQTVEAISEEEFFER
jgi:hypothetical protein